MTNLDYFDDDISIIVNYALFLWRECRHFNVDSLILSSWYNTLEAKQIQPDDGLEKGPKHVVVNILYNTVQKKFCCVLTTSYIYCIKTISILVI